MLDKAGQYLEAAQAYLSADRAGASDPQVLLRAGRAFFEARRLEDAINTFQALRQAFPDSGAAVEAGIDMAEANARQGQVRDALNTLRVLRRQTEGRPEELAVLEAMAGIFQDLELAEPLAETYRDIAALTSEPQVLARAARALIGAGMWEDGFSIANRVDYGAVLERTAYDLLLAHGEALLQTNAALAIEKLERAYQDYPQERTAEGDGLLLDTYLALDQPARARVLLADIEARAARNPVLNQNLHDAYATVGDYYFERQDWRAAEDLYQRILAEDNALEEDRQWAAFQQANILYRTGALGDAVNAYQAIAGTASPWANQAMMRAANAQLELRLLQGRPAQGVAAR